MFGGRARSLSSERKSTLPLPGGAGGPRSRSNERQSSIQRGVRSSLLDPSGQNRAPDFRAQKAENIKELMAILQELDYDLSKISLKVLQCPPSSVYLDIFKFLTDMICKGYELPPKHEEAIPHMYKIMGYPYTITKSAIVSIAPHSWPLLLHALLWQAKVILEMENFTILESPIVRFALETRNSSADKEEEMARLRASILGELEETIAAQREQHKVQLKQLEELKAATPSNIQELRDAVETSERGVNSLKKYKADMDFYTANKKEMLEDSKRRRAIQDQQLQEKAAICSELEHKVKTQEMTPEEVTVSKQKEAEIISKTKKKMDAIAEFDDRIWEEEIRQNQLIQELDTLCTKFNSELYSQVDLTVAEELKLTFNTISKDKVKNVVQPYFEEVYKTIESDEAPVHAAAENREISNRINKLKKELEHLKRKYKLSSDQAASAKAKLISKTEALQAANEAKLSELKAETKKAEEQAENLIALKAQYEKRKAELIKMSDDYEKLEAKKLADMRAAKESYMKRDKTQYEKQMKQCEILREAVEQQEAQSHQLDEILLLAETVLKQNEDATGDS